MVKDTNLVKNDVKAVKNGFGMRVFFVPAAIFALGQVQKAAGVKQIG